MPRKGRTINTYLLISLLVILLCGCAEKASAPEHSDCQLWHVKLENANPEFVADYIYLWDMLENEYPALSVAERLTGKNAQEIKNKYYKRIPLAKTAQDFYWIVVKPCLGEFEGAGHLYVIDNSFYKYQYALYSNIVDMDSCSKYNFDSLLSPQAKVFYSDVIEAAKKEMQSTAKNTPADSAYNSSDNLVFKYIPESSAAYVKVRQMNFYESSDNVEYNELADFFKKIESEGYKNCIVDIRSNGGGSDSYWMEGLVGLNSGKPLYSTNYALTKGIMCNDYLKPVFGKNIQPIKSFPSSKLPKLNKEDLKQFTSYIKLDRAYPCRAEGKALYTGKFWLLVDGGCYSSSESFAMFCKQTGFATLVGSRTGGDGAGCTPMVSALPNSGICIRFSAILTLNADGSGSEEFGTTPDYEISDGEDALEKCLSIIQTSLAISTP